MNYKEIIIDTCIESEAMRDYLKTQDICDYYLTEMIAGSALNLNQKLGLYKLIDDKFAKKFSLETQRAIENLEAQTGEIFCVTECWYDDEILDEKSSFSEPFTTYEAVLEYIREMMKDDEWDDETECWTCIEKYAPATDGKMDNTYTYYLIRDEIVYFERGRFGEAFDGYVNSLSLFLPIPFKVGDIVTLNSLPFAPVKQAILLEVDNSDCCGVQALFRRADGLWDTGALKHGEGWDNGYFPMLSTLYRLELYSNELFKEEQLMKEVQDYVRKDENNGNLLWNAIFHLKTDGVTEEKIRELIR